MTKENEVFENRMAKRLEEHSPQYDDKTMAKLAEARNAALNAIPESSEKHKGFHWTQMVYGAAACAVFSFVVFLIPTKQKQAPVVSQFEILMEAEDIEMLEEDIEFYVWLENELEKEAS